MTIKHVSAWYTHRRFWRSTSTAFGVALFAFAGVGCNLSDTGPSPYLPPDQYFTVLSFEHHAINLSTVAPYDTVTLNTTRAMGDGSVVPGEVVYSTNSPSLSITNSVLKATGAVAKAEVYATMTSGTITRVDTAVVSVMGTAPDPLSDFGMRLAAGDSAKTGAARYTFKAIPLLRQSVSGADLSALIVSLRSSDSTVVAITQSGSAVNIYPKRPGRAMLYASTYAFGTTWRDSLVFTAGWPVNFTMNIYERTVSGALTNQLYFGYNDITIGVGGCVIWTAQSAKQDIDMQFEDPSHIGPAAGSVCPVNVQFMHADVSGNIAPYRAILWDGRPVETEEDLEAYMNAFFSRYRARTFSMPGVFRYRSDIQGVSGQVRVCDEAADTICAPRGLGGWY